MQAHGASTQGVLAWGFAVAVVLMIVLTMKSGTFYQPFGHPIERARQPALFWLLTVLLSAVAAAFACAGLWLDLHAPSYVRV